MVQMTAQKAKELGYYVYAHEDYKKEKLPLIVFLHGAGERGDGEGELELVLKIALPRFLMDKDLHPRCVAVFPQCPKGQNWISDIPRVLRFVDEVEALYGTDPARVTLTGVSMGGYGTWCTALTAPERFWRIAPVCGGGMPWAAGALKMPIRAFHGLADTVVAPSYSIDMIEAVRAKAHNTDARLTLYHGVGHDSWTTAYDSTLLAFLVGEE